MVGMVRAHPARPSFFGQIEQAEENEEQAMRHFERDDAGLLGNMGVGGLMGMGALGRFGMGMAPLFANAANSDHSCMQEEAESCHTLRC